MLLPSCHETLLSQKSQPPRNPGRLTITENAHGPDHPTVGIRLNNLAVILDDLKQPGKALSPANRALAIAEAAHDTDHPEVAGRLNNLAVILRNLRRTTEAKSLAERALAITETIHGPDHYEVCIPLYTLASVLWELGEQESAIQLAKRAKAIRQAHPHLPLRPARGKNPDALPEDASLTHQTDHQIQFRRFENQTEDPPGSAF